MSSNQAAGHVASELQLARTPRTTIDHVNIDVANIHPAARMTHGLSNTKGAALKIIRYSIIRR